MSLFGTQTASQQNRRILGFHPQTSISGQPIAILGGTRKLAGNVVWTGDWQSTPVKNGSGKGGGKASGGGKGGGGDLTYNMSCVIELCRGPITQMGRVWEDRTLFKNIGGTRYRAVSGSDPTSNAPLPDIDLELFAGFKGQAPWGYLTTNFSDKALGYSEVAYIAGKKISLGQSGMIPNFNWELTGILANYNGGLDCDPAAFAYEVMTNVDWGAGLLLSDVGPIAEASNYAVANGLFCSPLIDTQKSAAEVLNEMALIGNWAWVNSEGLIKLRSYGDTNVAGNGATFAANITPIYDLGDNDFLAAPGEEPVTVTIPTIRDSYNYVSVEWLNRDNGYNEEPIYEDDQASIQQHGLRANPIISAHSICDHAVASKVCSIATKRATNQRRRFQFKLGWQYGLLEPMDLVTITDPYLGLSRQVVRILTISEDENGQLDIESEEFIDGLAKPTLHPKQATAGFTPGYFASPGSVFQPIFFEAVPQLTQDVGHELIIGLCGGPNWGGCTVWHSLDNTTYENVGSFQGPSIMGAISASLAAGTVDPDTATLSVDLTESFGMLASVSASDADSFQTLLDVNGELISFSTATLTGVNKYDITYLHRGVFSTVNVGHALGDPILSLNGPTFSFPYNSPDIGKIHYFKYTSVNKAGQQEELLSDAVAYSHTIVTAGTASSSGGTAASNISFISAASQKNTLTGLVDVATVYAPPSDATAKKVHFYLEAPDFSGSAGFVAVVTAIDVAAVPGSRLDLCAYDVESADASGHVSIIIPTGLPYPSQSQTWRIYGASVNAAGQESPLIPANQASPTPSLVLTVPIADVYGIGQEYAPLVTGISTDPLGFPVCNVIIDTRKGPSGWEYRTNVFWADPTAANNPDRIQQFVGVQIDLTRTQGGSGFGRYRGGDSKVAGSWQVAPASGTWTSDYQSVPDPQEKFAGDVLSRGDKGINTFSPLITPQFSFTTPLLSGLIAKGGAITVGAGEHAGELADVTNFGVTAEYQHNLTGSWQVAVIPTFTLPTDTAWSKIALVTEQPTGSGNYFVLGFDSAGNGLSQNPIVPPISTWPTVAGETWDFIAVSLDRQGSEKWTDIETLDAIRAAGGTPNFGTSPRVTTAMPLPYEPDGSGTEVAPLVGGVTAAIVFDGAVDGTEFYHIAGDIAFLPTDDPRFWGYNVYYILPGNILWKITEGVADQTHFEGTRQPIPSGSTNVQIVVLSVNAAKDRNNYVLGVTPGVLCSNGPLTTRKPGGNLNLGAVDMTSVNTAHFEKDSATGKYQVKSAAISSRELADGTVNYNKFFSGLRPTENVAVLPTNFTNYPANSVVTVIGDVNHKLYRSTGTAWTTSVPGSDIVVDSAFIGTLQTVDLSASRIVTGIGKIGGTNAPGVFGVFDGTNTQIGFIGTASGVSGAWFKTFGVGGTGYSDAPLKTDSSGNLTITNATISIAGPSGSNLQLDGTNGLKFLGGGGYTQIIGNALSITDGFKTSTLRSGSLSLQTIFTFSGTVSASTFEVITGGPGTGPGIYWDGLKVGGPRVTGPSNSTDTTNVALQFNALLAALRNFGIIS